MTSSCPYRTALGDQFYYATRDLRKERIVFRENKACEIAIVSMYAIDVFVFFCFALLACILTRWINSLINRSKLAATECSKEPPVRKSKLPFGIDFVIEGLRAIDEKKFLEHNHAHFERLGDTFENSFLGIQSIVTRDPRNIQAVLATKFDHFDHGYHRYRSFRPLLGDGIFTLDGEGWSHSRALLRPHFATRNYQDLGFLMDHVERLVTKIKERQAQVIDLQPLFFSLTLDTSTEFLLGKSVHSLERDGRTPGFSRSFNYALRKLFQRAQAGGFYRFINSAGFRSACEEVRKFVAQTVRDAVADRELDGHDDQDAVESTAKRQCLLQDLLQDDVFDERAVEDQLLNLLVAGRDTTASLLTHVCFELARHPSVFKRLQSDVLARCGTALPSTSDLREIYYLKWVINEALRLYPPVPMNMRIANCDVAIPIGGGSDGLSPIIVKKGEAVAYSLFSMHRNKKIYGDDAHEFKPERWIESKGAWEFLPFNGGPRICLGQQLAVLEISYVLVRIMQTVSSMRLAQRLTWKENLSLTLSSSVGCPVLLHI